MTLCNFKTDGYNHKLIIKKHRILPAILASCAMFLFSCGAGDGTNYNPVELGGNAGNPCQVGGHSGTGGTKDAGSDSAQGGHCGVGGFLGHGGFAELGGWAGHSGFGGFLGHGGFAELGGWAGTAGVSGNGGSPDCGCGGIAGAGGNSGTGGVAGNGGLSGNGGTISTGGVAGNGGDIDSGTGGTIDSGTGGIGGDIDSGTGGTGGNTDVPPTVVLTDPLNNAEIYSLHKTLFFTFSEAMLQSTISPSNFALMNGIIPVQGSLNYVGNNVEWSFTPDNNFDLNTNYIATVSNNVQDLAGSNMVNAYSWNFTTSPCSLLPIDLKSTDSFVVLAGATVTSTGPTSITGDLGVSPGSAVVGFPPGNIVGIEHVGDPTAALAIFDLTAAYNNAAGRVLCPISVAGNLGGMTLYPGLYKSTSSLAISSGDLTLDANGDEDAIFIFQMASTLTTTSARQVILTNGAKASNIFWQVGTSATFGSTSSFFGTVMADQAITMETGATLTGRILARIAAVSLDSNVIVKPAP